MKTLYKVIGFGENELRGFFRSKGSEVLTLDMLLRNLQWND